MDTLNFKLQAKSNRNMKSKISPYKAYMVTDYSAPWHSNYLVFYTPFPSKNI
jgi:hypothetical protein